MRQNVECRDKSEDLSTARGVHLLAWFCIRKLFLFTLGGTLGEIICLLGQAICYNHLQMEVSPAKSEWAHYPCSGWSRTLDSSRMDAMHGKEAT